MEPPNPLCSAPQKNTMGHVQCQHAWPQFRLSARRTNAAHWQYCAETHARSSVRPRYISGNENPPGFVEPLERNSTEFVRSFTRSLQFQRPWALCQHKCFPRVEETSSSNGAYVGIMEDDTHARTRARTHAESKDSAHNKKGERLNSKCLRREGNFLSS